jgi:hypothetical protein
MLRSFLLVILLTSTNGFQFLANFKVAPPADIEKEAKMKARFGDKSKCSITFDKYQTRSICLLTLVFYFTLKNSLLSPVHLLG